MKFKSSIHYLRNTAVVLGALAVAPLAAQAMLMEHDTSRLEADSSLTTDKRVSGTTDDVLARRFGAYSGIGANGSVVSESAQAADQAPTGNTTTTDQRSDPVYMRAP